MKKAFLLLLFLNSAPFFLLGQTATLRGIVLSENNKPLEAVNITYNQQGTLSNENGYYELKIPANTTVQISFSHLGFKPIILNLILKNGEDREFNPIMKNRVEQIGEVVIAQNHRKIVEGITNLSPEQIRKLPGANPGVENLLKSLPGVNSNNELSTQYSVRGGNFDENLVYVNEIEIYRPFLIRSGQQEGLSFINPDLIQNIDFSSGGFKSQYGDKLSSVLDITYKKPIDFGISLQASLLGGSVTIETADINSKFTTISSVRYRDNSLLVNSKETETNFRPRFIDGQTLLSYNLSGKVQLNFFGNISINDYDYKPLTRQTNFGTLQNPIALIVQYQGQEKTNYQTALGALKANFFINKNLTLKIITSTHHATEQENFDILASYALGEVNTDIGDQEFGNASFTQAIGSQLNHARNKLDALIFNTEHKGVLTLNNHQFDWGIKYTHEDIRDRLVEWEVIDSAGFVIRPPLEELQNQQPYRPYQAPLVPYQSVRATNFTQINRISGYTQWSHHTEFGKHQAYINTGIRVHKWNIWSEDKKESSQIVVSPRAQFSLKPNWKHDMLFRVSGGWYYQPPMYRELRDSIGYVNTKVKAQKSIHFVAGNEYSFRIWNRPFKLTSEIYYKKLTNVNTYTLENVRIRYRASTDAKAYAYGFDTRLHGEFVPGTDSWFSFGYMKTEENIRNQGYIARPTDQRLKFAVLFQDYMPAIPNLKLYLNMVYNTGLPGGSPSYADPYQFQSRLPDYKRADLGLSHIIVGNNKLSKKNWLNRFKELTLGFEIFNVFDMQNSITNTWVRDASTSRQYGIPNYMTGRVFNVKINAQL